MSHWSDFILFLTGPFLFFFLGSSPGSNFGETGREFDLCCLGFWKWNTGWDAGCGDRKLVGLITSRFGMIWGLGLSQGRMGEFGSGLDWAVIGAHVLIAGGKLAALLQGEFVDISFLIVGETGRDWGSCWMRAWGWSWGCTSWATGDGWRGWGGKKESFGSEVRKFGLAVCAGRQPKTPESSEDKLSKIKAISS